ncbi:MAG TPA: tripartite tricarboxylate transporter substrate binding protein [Xanthobacteraceae bacterium]|jgi:tripartite-type tricarboxylate transporter receptor subunit TctC
MNLRRRDLLHLAAAAAALPTSSRLARAQTYPTRPVRIVAGFSPGSTTDIIARLIGRWLQEQLGQPVIVENRPGAGGTIGAEAVVRAAPDGYTLLLAGSNNAINETLYDKLGYDFVRDIAPVALIDNVPNLVVVNPAFPAKTIPEFIAYAKANPGKVNMGSAGNGTSSHLAGELFKMEAGVNLMHIPYRGQPAALADLLAGQVQVSFAPTPPTIELVRAGKLRALAVTSATRLEALPNVPTVAEFVPGYEASTWSGLGAPRNTPTAIVDKLNKVTNAGLADSKLKATFTDMGGVVLGGSTGDFAKFIAAETQKWAKVIKFAGIKAE